MYNTLNQRSQQAARPRRLDSRRLWGVLIFFAVFGLYNSGKLFSLQVLQYSDLADRAEERIRWKDTISPMRGLILDARGQLLAGNTTAQDLYVDKTHADDEQVHKIAELLAPALGQGANDLFTRIKNTDSTNIRVASRLDPNAVARINELIEANSKLLLYKVRFETQPKRQYPGDTLAASLLGFTDYENAGHYGVEEYYNAQLAGKPGWIVAEHDAEGRPLVFQQPEMQPAENGADLVLTIDSAVQYLAERELNDSIQEYKAESGYIIVQDPNTGGILAMANWPTFNPNDFNKINDYGLFRNPVVNDVREPGSTMKILTYASSMDAGAITPDTQVNSLGYMTRYGWTIYNATHRAYGWETMTEGLGRSDNIASMFAAEKLGEDRFFEYIKAFGIGKRTGIDLAGEVAGLITYPGEKEYSPINLYTNSFGQGVATTPIQLVSAVSAVANGGKLVRPHVMQQVAKDGKPLETYQTQEVRQVIKPETAHTIADMLAFGVENGLVARFSHVAGYHVSVKTGTAQLAENGVYTTAGSFASAMGFAPSHGAKFTLYIGIMNPKTSQWGENTASRSWGRLAKELLMYMKVQPTEPLPTPTATP
jgi:cell division protein FtsI/penicillin-binding protein 2